MSKPDLSDLVKDLVGSTFQPQDQTNACSLLAASCSSDLPLVGDDPSLIERIQIAVIKQANGSLASMETWIGEAQEDWRDVLDCAEFYSDPQAHRSWRP